MQMILAVIFIFYSAVSSAVIEDNRQEAYQECLLIKKHLLDNDQSLQCLGQYQLFTSNSTYRPSSEKVRVGSFNSLHPGSGKTRFKDFNLVAAAINNFDLIATQELLPMVGTDKQHNDRILKFMEEAPQLAETLTQRAKEARDQANYELIIKRRDKLLHDSAQAPELILEPGYLKILKALRMKDKSWSLLLSPMGVAAEENYVHELFGFFYRASKVRPIQNPYCRSLSNPLPGVPKGEGLACFPDFGKSLMGRDTNQVFSRRPFLASFQSGSFAVSLLAAHSVFKSPENEGERRRILGTAFGESAVDEIFPGIENENYARIAEASLLVEFLDKYSDRYRDHAPLIVAGDMNLEANESFWPHLLDRLKSDAQILVDWQTSLANQRFNSLGDKTFGLSKNFDHFIVRPDDLRNCFYGREPQLRRLSFFEGELGRKIEDLYIVRSFTVDVIGNGGEYSFSSNGRSIMQRQVLNWQELVKQKKTIKLNEIAPFYTDPELEAREYQKRIFTRQLEEKNFYRVYMEILSDHFPIGIDCEAR